MEGVDPGGLLAFAFDLEAPGDAIGHLPVPPRRQAVDLAGVHTERVELQAQERRAEQAQSDERGYGDAAADQPADRAEGQEALQHPPTPLR